MKKVILALASLGMAAMFTACDDSSSGDSGKLVSCDINVSMSFPVNSMNMRFCGESAKSSEVASQVEQLCGAAAQEQFSSSGYSLDLNKGTGCPSGYVKTCPSGDVTVYIYGDSASEMDCDDVKNFTGVLFK